MSSSENVRRCAFECAQPRARRADARAASIARVAGRGSPPPPPPAAAAAPPPSGMSPRPASPPPLQLRGARAARARDATRPRSARRDEERVRESPRPRRKLPVPEIEPVGGARPRAPEARAILGPRRAARGISLRGRCGRAGRAARPSRGAAAARRRRRGGRRARARRPPRARARRARAGASLREVRPGKIWLGARASSTLGLR